MRRAPVLLLGFVLGVSACFNDRPSGPEANGVPAASSAPSSGLPEQDTEWRRAAFELVRAEHRWPDPWPRPERWVEQSCAGRVAADLEPAQRQLSVRVQDDRWEKQDLIPYSLSSGLTTPEVSDARAVLERHRLAGETQKELRETRLALEALRKRPYVAVFHVIHHKPASVIHKLGQIRPEWVAGLLQAWLVVHDAEELEPICQVSVVARNSVGNAPLSRRLRPSVLARLERELIEETWRQARQRLSAISSGLTLPAGSARGPALRELSGERPPRRAQRSDVPAAREPRAYASVTAR